MVLAHNEERLTPTKHGCSNQDIGNREGWGYRTKKTRRAWRNIENVWQQTAFEERIKHRSIALCEANAKTTLVEFHGNQRYDAFELYDIPLDTGT
jgi:hypothetical protein